MSGNDAVKPKGTYPNRLADARRAAGLTQQQAADALGITLAGYQFLEYGRRELKASNITRLADAFGTTTDYLIRMDEGIAPLPLAQTIRFPEVVLDLTVAFPHASDQLLGNA